MGDKMRAQLKWVIGLNTFEICVTNADGTHLVHLTDNALFEGTVARSVDGGGRLRIRRVQRCPLGGQRGAQQGGGPILLHLTDKSSRTPIRVPAARESVDRQSPPHTAGRLEDPCDARHG